MQQAFVAEKALGFQQITNVSAAIGLTVPAGTTLILVHTTGQAVRWRDDGTSPTGTVGMVLAVGSELRYSASAMAALKFIESAASAVLNVTYYG